MKNSKKKARSGGMKINASHYEWRLFQRDNGIWYADGRGKHPSLGKHSLATRDCEDARKAVTALDQAMAIQHGLLDPRDAPNSGAEFASIDVGIDAFREHVGRDEATGGVRSATRKRYDAALDHIRRFCHLQRLSHWGQFRERQADHYATSRSKAGAKPKTVYLELTLLKQLVKFLAERGLAPAGWELKTKVPKPDASPTYCYTRQQVAAMIRHCREVEGLEWLADIILGLARTGLRIGEFVNLQAEDIDLERQVIRVVSENGKLGNSSIRRTKSGKSREVPIHPELLPVLKRLLKGSPGPVFRTASGNQLRPDRLREQYVKKALVPILDDFPNDRLLAEGRLHSFRHHFCSEAIRQGVSQQTAMAWMGHRDPAMTQHYFHLHHGDAAREISKLEPLQLESVEQSNTVGNVAGVSLDEPGDLRLEPREDETTPEN
ncbi:tyrosine-type recombinase/integrase [Stratiformator vulcanicus]|uniref:Tn916 familye transposase n=1 Tax=Stratiformator vulcanicus TaxID=2527980 RepID=A0A517QWF6_9PLAN|nr:site-specific integrase [Stratiformator vulcanicus]QDT35996.1 Tn916 familye transposase [Stratiformator vulcanicus]